MMYAVRPRPSPRLRRGPASAEVLEARRLFSAVTSLTLVDADTGTDLVALEEGIELDLRTFPSRSLNIRADVSGEVESVVFSLDDVAAAQTENNLPYALAGDGPGGYRAWTPSLGTHTITATPYSADDAAGTAGEALRLTFMVIDGVPAAPSAPAARAVSPGEVALRWADNSDNEQGFIVERSYDYGRRFTPVATLPPDSTAYTDDGVLVGRTYVYRVTAFNEAGRTRGRKSGLFRFDAPPVPENVTAAAVSDSSVHLSWTNRASRQSGSIIERSSDGVTFERLTELGVGVLEYTDSGLLPDQTYYYRLMAYNAVGYSRATDVVGATTEPAEQPQVPEVIYSDPIVITQGGVYTGNWQSLDPDVAAVTIKTTEPVVIENANVRGRDNLIDTGVDHAHVTVRNTRGYGLNPDVYGQVPGRFFEAVRFDSVTLENNYLEGTAGINLFDYRGDYTTADTIRIVGNKALNIDGRRSDGAGGYLDFDERTRLRDGVTEKGYRMRQFVQLNRVMDVPGIEIAWNEIVNEPGKSRVEDNISIYYSGGTADSPLRIHDNYVRGAYTIKPWQTSYSDETYSYDWDYSGGGIMLGDGDANHVVAYDNQVVSTSNYGIAISAGHDMAFYNNRLVSSGLLPDGRWIAEQNVGAYIWDLHNAGPAEFYNNRGYDNLIGWVRKPDGSRNDWWIPDATSFENNTRWAGPITLAAEADELGYWLQKLAGAERAVGPAA